MSLEALEVLANGAVELIAAQLDSPEAGVRVYAAYALGRMAPDKVLPLLQKALEDPDDCVRTFAAMILPSLCGEQALPLLEKRCPTISKLCVAVLPRR